ncbi:carboxylesterase [Corynebacterium phocae]|uniref:Carboxylic ester hydrolase n=1 Tax=Corynebacterium phocae TaxID=161895 RepID=A0A1L7D3R2_9CORY|nr:carboxylesterase/lipase family protein [Corynebacterium phocae]APT92806.1 carboxylesterase [Corynebacterium phocae]KAA8723119.1 carboxylesterase/lipase family protein [Corynebacterium phocae]
MKDKDWDDALTVRTRAGWVRGVKEPLGDGASVRSWRGVPFGADTSGARRFCGPHPPKAWDGVRDCTEFGPVAPQSTYSWTDKVVGSEDCLNLDVVRPGHSGGLPVVVYFHGGSFFMGSSHMVMLRGFQLAHTMDVVYVSVNFRLGALGYLDMRSLDGHACANPAMADQILALEWVRDNIAAFGGDPDDVTLMGESAGGAAVLALMTSPAAEGLFHKAIAQSPPIATVHSRTQSTLWVRKLVERLELPRMSSIDDIRAQDFADIIRAGQSMMWRGRGLLNLNSSFAPTVDGDILPEHPLAVFERGGQHPVPLLIGTNSDEASVGKFLFQRQFARRRGGLRLLSSFDAKGAEFVVEAYNGATTRADFAQLLTDALFWAPAVAVAGAHSEVAPTYMYRFDFAPVALEALGLGALHSLELSHIFGDPESSRMSVLTRLGSTAQSDALSELMQAHWARFIHQAAPGKTWPRYQVAPRAGAGLQPGGQPAVQGQRLTQVFAAQSYVESDPHKLRRRAWEHCDMREWGAGRPDLAEELGFILDTLD